MTGKLMTADELAVRLRVSLSRVYALAREDRVDGVVRIGRQVRFDPERVAAWIGQGGQRLPGGWRREPDRADVG